MHKFYRDKAEWHRKEVILNADIKKRTEMVHKLETDQEEMRKQYQGDLDKALAENEKVSTELQSIQTHMRQVKEEVEGKVNEELDRLIKIDRIPLEEEIRRLQTEIDALRASDSKRSCGEKRSDGAEVLLAVSQSQPNASSSTNAGQTGGISNIHVQISQIQMNQQISQTQNIINGRNEGGTVHEATIPAPLSSSQIRDSAFVVDMMKRTQGEVERVRESERRKADERAEIDKRRCEELLQKETEKYEELRAEMESLSAQYQLAADKVKALELALDAQVPHEEYEKQREKLKRLEAIEDTWKKQKDELENERKMERHVNFAKQKDLESTIQKKEEEIDEARRFQEQELLRRHDLEKECTKVKSDLEDSRNRARKLQTDMEQLKRDLEKQKADRQSQEDRYNTNLAIYKQQKIELENMMQTYVVGPDDMAQYLEQAKRLEEHAELRFKELELDRRTQEKEIDHLRAQIQVQKDKCETEMKLSADLRKQLVDADASKMKVHQLNKLKKANEELQADLKQLKNKHEDLQREKMEVEAHRGPEFIRV